MTPARIEQIAREFHDTYERLAPQFGYETKPETRSFDTDSPNGKLMIAVCAIVARAIRNEALEDAAKECDALKKRDRKEKLGIYIDDSRF